jgi:4-alpha-glucanotransferase/(1->4)-alpha-D-glucan 1-alpha-D-glucosylmutase
MIDPRLATLCRLFDIESSYVDIWGNTHAIAEETAHALLAAMGVDLARQSMDDVIAEREADIWRNPLPVVHVVRGESRTEIPLRLPEDGAAATIGYSLTFESGDIRRETVRPRNLAVRERVTLSGSSYAAYGLALADLPLGYHRLALDAAPGVETTLIVCPVRCYLPEAIADEGRVWGPALQLYALRSARNWGIGDFTDLRFLLEHLAEQGAGIVGVNPLHALYPHRPESVSPYSPSSRLFLNVLYIDVEGVADFAQCAQAQQIVYAPEFQRRLEELREAELVDYAGVANAKFTVLEILYQHFREQHLARQTGRAQAFREFQARAGKSLERQALYDALQEHFFRQDRSSWGWPVWPEAFRDPRAPEVARWAEQNRERVEYFEYLQWQAERQLTGIARRSSDLGLGIGLYQDLAVSVDRGGAETWAWRSVYARDISIGAPPDEFSLFGQDWGLPPPVPSRLRATAYAPFIAMLRANMRHAGALRVDHALGLMRLYWIPVGTTADRGAYVRYPIDDLLGVLALESQRNRCVVVGEDLGTVPPELVTALAETGVLSSRVFYFERAGTGELNPPEAYPANAAAAVSTHDLPTLAGFWKGQDLAERERLKLFPTEEIREQQVLARAQDRARVLMALARAGLLPEGLTVDPASSPEMVPALARAVHVYLARGPSKIVTFQLEDTIGESQQANLPGTTDAYPNWRRKIALDVEHLVKDARIRALFEALHEARGSGRVTSQPRRTDGEPAMPSSTYRLQFHRDFTFRDAAALVPYLARLGIGACYASPYLKARPGSRHGYDIVDHNALNPEIGSPEDYDAFVGALQAHGLGQVLDIVPNHMGVGSDNQWWVDVLENGPASLYAAFFDIDWRPLKAELRGKVLLPVLGDHYGQVLERGELRVVWQSESGSFQVQYFEHRFPIDPATYPLILERDIDHLEQALGVRRERFVEFQSIVAAFRNLPPRSERGPDRVIERNRDKEINKKRLAEACAAEPSLQAHVMQAIGFYHGSGGNNIPQREALHSLLEHQAYRLAYWRVAADEVNYRRFFDINDLAGLRMENAQTFFTTHRLISELVTQGKVNGLRIDHPDGLYDPLGYYERLQNLVSAASTVGGAAVRKDALYVVVEKILASYEHLPTNWPVHGTTGYDFTNLVNGLFVDARSEEALDRIYARFIRATSDFDELLADRKRLIMRVALSSELNVLANHLNRLSEADWYARDFTLNALRYALREVVACFPVYRTYIGPEGMTEEDRRYIEWAVAQAKKRSTAADVSVFDFIKRILLQEDGERLPEAYRQGMLDFAMRFQQYTAPVMAKGLEDTSFYSYNRLVSLNEVGGDPRRFGVSVAAFHRAIQERVRHFPHSMLATSTHDTKRSEDVRTRINVLSELPDEWRAAVARWSRMNRSKKRKLETGFAPDRNDEYLLYQTLFGIWPPEQGDGDALGVLRQRVEDYLLKATREAKVHTSWINPNVEYEEATREFVRALFASDQTLFLQDLSTFVRRVSLPGLCNSLSQVLLKLTVPGVPDIYQGNEIWDFSLVDPDNRRPVDYARREQMLHELETQLREPDPRRVRALLDRIEDGCAKLYLTWKVLQRRRRLAELFRDGEYLPLAATGARTDRLCVFARRHDGGCIVVAVPRLSASGTPVGTLPLGPVWEDTRFELPQAGAYENVFTGEVLQAEAAGDRHQLRVAAVLRYFPVGLLELRSG